VGRAKRIIDALTAFGETGQAVFLAQRPDAVTASGQNFVGITLVAHIPDDFVPRRVEHRMQSHGQLDNPKARAQMAAGF